MKIQRLIFALTCAAVLVPAGVHALTFELQELRLKTLDGGSVDLYFKHDENKVFYRPPAGWTLEQSASRFVARPPGGVGGTMELRTIKPIADLGAPGASETLEAYQKVVLAGLPKDAESAKVVESAAEKFGGGALPCTRVLVEYQMLNSTRNLTLCYVQFRPDLWVEVRIESLVKDFGSVHAVALHSLEAFTEVQAPAPTPATATVPATQPTAAR